AAGDVVWVTNGVYASGGKVMSGDLTNRVVLDKALTVQSVNGPFVTSIQGAGVTYGPLAIRCAWLTNGAQLKGFTITGGATRGSGAGSLVNVESGVGVWGEPAGGVMTRGLMVADHASCAEAVAVLSAGDPC